MSLDQLTIEEVDHDQDEELGTSRSASNTASNINNNNNSTIEEYEYDGSMSPTKQQQKYQRQKLQEGVYTARDIGYEFAASDTDSVLIDSAKLTSVAESLVQPVEEYNFDNIKFMVVDDGKFSLASAYLIFCLN